MSASDRPLVADDAGQGPAVALLHGQPGSADSWARVVPLLVGDFRLVVPDRPGYGRTGGDATGFAGNARALVDLMDRRDIDRAVVVGHSWGGGAALAAAARYPDRVAGLVLVASVAPGEPIGWGDRLLAAPVAGATLAFVTIGATGRVLASPRVQALAGRRLPRPALDAVRQLTRLTGADSGTRVWRSFVVEQRALLGELDGLAPRLASMTLPVAVLNGSVDRVVPPSVGALLSKSIPGATHTLLPGAHHLLPFDHPADIARAVREVAARAGWVTLDTGNGTASGPNPGAGGESGQTDR